MTEEKDVALDLPDSKIELLKRTICKGATDDELELFIHACKRTRLDPFMKQIHAVKRWDNGLKREVMSIQTGIDGYRLIAERTGKYVPGRENQYTYDAQGALVSATAFVKKQANDGSWHEISATVFWKEYVAVTKDGTPNMAWRTKGHIMLGKCAEASVLRKGFPADLSGIYTEDEMEQASNPKIEEAVLLIPKSQVVSINKMIDSDKQPKELMDSILSRYAVSCLEELKADKVVTIIKNIQARQEKQKTEAVKPDPTADEVAALFE